MARAAIPFYGLAVFAEFAAAGVDDHPFSVCLQHAQEEDAAEHAPPGHSGGNHCHLLDEPSHVAAQLEYGFTQVIWTLISEEWISLLAGFGGPPDIPPENLV